MPSTFPTSITGIATKPIIAVPGLWCACGNEHREISAGREVDLFVCENGFIALNPPLTPGRVGSPSTRTTHPMVFAHLRAILANLNLRVNVMNPYPAKTKGEITSGCKDQPLLESLATQSTSCSRFKQCGYKHCGRCVPCLVRRAAFERWKGSDSTVYRFDDLGRDDPNYAGFDDVRSTMMAITKQEARHEAMVGSDSELGADRRQRRAARCSSTWIRRVGGVTLKLNVQ